MKIHHFDPQSRLWVYGYYPDGITEFNHRGSESPPTKTDNPQPHNKCPRTLYIEVSALPQITKIYPVELPPWGVFMAIYPLGSGKLIMGV